MDKITELAKEHPISAFLIVGMFFINVGIIAGTGHVASAFIADGVAFLIAAFAKFLTEL